VEDELSSDDEEKSDDDDDNNNHSSSISNSNSNPINSKLNAKRHAAAANLLATLKCVLPASSGALAGIASAGGAGLVSGHLCMSVFFGWAQPFRCPS